MQVVWGTFFFFFFLFSKQRKCSFSAILWPIWLGKKKRKKKTKTTASRITSLSAHAAAAAHPAASVTSLVWGSQLAPSCTFLACPDAQATVPKHPPCPCWVQRHRAPQHPAQQGPRAPGCFVLCHPPAHFVAPFLPAHGFELAECLLPL